MQLRYLLIASIKLICPFAMATVNPFFNPNFQLIDGSNVNYTGDAEYTSQTYFDRTTVQSDGRFGSDKG